MSWGLYRRRAFAHKFNSCLWELNFLNDIIYLCMFYLNNYYIVLLVDVCKESGA